MEEAAYAGLTPEQFWSWDEYEVLVVIKGHQRRNEDLDRHLAHHALQVLAPYRKKGARRPKVEDYMLRPPQKADAPPEGSPVADLDARRERFDRLREEQGAAPFRVS